MIGWVDGVPVPRARLDERVAELRAGHLAARLPAVGSKEDRQFLRWTAQVLLTEELCRVESARLHGDAEPVRATASGPQTASGPETISASETASDPLAVSSPRTASDPQTASTPAAQPRTPATLTQAESVHLGSINAAAWSACPEMAELYYRVTTATTPAEVPTPRRTWHRVMHSVAATALGAETATPVPLGWTTLDDLPLALAAELRTVPAGIRVGPIRSSLGWHVATVVATEVRADPQPGREAAASTAASTTAGAAASAAAGIDPPRLTAFNRWLDERRRALVRPAPGFEHPGDPAQPDNTHRH